MKTDGLVKALAADAKSVEPPITRTLAVAIALGTVISLVCFLRALGVRPDFLQSMTDSGRFIFKFMLTLSVAVPGFVLLRGMSRLRAGKQIVVAGFGAGIAFGGGGVRASRCRSTRGTPG